MKNIFTIMDSDHKVIENLIVKIKSEHTSPITIFHEMKNKLLQHFAWEEEVLFPEFETRAGSYGTGIIYILKAEHKQILKIYIENIEKRLTADSHTNANLLIYGLGEILRMHKTMENEVFYPWFEKNLKDKDIKILINRMKKISSSKIK